MKKTNTPFKHIIYPLACALYACFTPPFSGMLHAQQSTDSMLVWSANRKLTVKDFRQQTDNFADHIGYGYKMSSLLDISIYNSPYHKGDTSFEYNIFPVFYPYSSWLDDTAKLAHEQLHFDISEMYARLMRKRLEEMKGKPHRYRNAATELQALYDAHEACHVKYDRESNRGRFPNMQIYWERLVHNQLDSLSNYNHAHGRVSLKP